VLRAKIGLTRAAEERLPYSRMLTTRSGRRGVCERASMRRASLVMIEHEQRKGCNLEAPGASANIKGMTPIPVFTGTCANAKLWNRFTETSANVSDHGHLRHEANIGAFVSNRSHLVVPASCR
jgi:hypothetical protein